MKEKEGEENGNSDTADYGDVYFRYGDTIPAKRSHRKVFGYAAMFLVIQNSTWLFTFFLADEGVYNDTTIDGLLQMSAGLIMLAICVKYYLQLRKKAKNE